MRGVTVRLAYLSQDVAELDPGAAGAGGRRGGAREVDLGKGRSITATQLCERFGFVGNAQWTPVGELSGGERRRLQLLRLLMDEPNVLLLDEPTNDLDIDTLTALEDLLDGWAGTLLVVSHDRYFLERVCDTTVALLGDGGLRDLPGGVDEYLALRRAAAAAAGRPGRRPRVGQRRGAVRRPQRRRRADAAATRAARKELARLERQMEKLRDREARLHDEMAAAAADHERVLELDAEPAGAARGARAARAPVAGAGGGRRGVISGARRDPGRRTLRRMPVALEWGPVGARTLAESSDVVVVVDVLSFSTSLTVAVERGAKVWPHTGGESARQLARDIDAVLAGNRSSHEGLTLSPASLLGRRCRHPRGAAVAERLVDRVRRGQRRRPGGRCLPAQRGGGEPLPGRLRPDRPRAGWRAVGRRVAAPGVRGPGRRRRRGRPAGRPRPRGAADPEAEVAALAFRALRPLEMCPSGAELVERGYAEDVRIASEIDVSTVVPVLVEGRFVAA